MKASRRTLLAGSLAMGLAAHPLMGCDRSSKTRVHTMGVIHSNHRRSETYSLAVLEAAIRKASPDVILTEIPPDRIDRAITTFAALGVVDEPRTQVFPEYTEVVFPLSNQFPFRLYGCAGWTREIADNRRAALERIQSDPSRADQWAEHLVARREYSRAIAGRGDDPLFIHTDEFDQIVEKSREPYQVHFDGDLGSGGWTQINRAHNDLINAALDEVNGQGLTALIMFGSAHKYMIKRRLDIRSDIVQLNTRDLFV
ncbi:MAG: hypothetical protein AAF697_05595 [Pseudomonadota bacterium]